MKDRLKASELLGKSLAMFTENLRHGDSDGKPLSFNVIIGDKHE
jgi:hypothetical protein